MSRILFNRHRLLLLAGTSFAALTLVAITPGAASAQAVCTAVPSSGAGTNSVNFAGGTYNPGLSCTASGGDMLVTTSGNITVSSSGGVPGARTPNGLNLTATGANGVSFVSAAEGSVVGGNLSAGSQTNGPLIDALTQNGDISITTGTLSATANGTTHGIFARSTGTGDIGIDARRGVSMGTSTAITNVSVAAIEAHTTTGSILIEAGNDTSASAISGGRRTGAVGIITESDGPVTVNLINTNLHGTFEAGRATGVAMRASGAGSVELNIDWTLPLGTSASTTETEQRGLGGSVDFSELAGGAVISIGEMASWEISGLADSVFGAGDDEVNIGAGGYMFLRVREDITALGSGPMIAEDRYVFDFGDGDNRLLNEGALLIGVDSSQNNGLLVEASRYEGELRLENLTTFENAGTIYMGARALRTPGAFEPGYTGSLASFVAGSDLWADDILAMPGAHFIGGTDSRLLLDIDFNAANQESCDASLRTVDGDLAADCIDLRGGSATGQTLVTIGDPIAGDRGAFNPDGLVVVDVSGGSAEAGAFILDPDQPGYATAGDQAYYDKGLFAYVLAYDEEQAQFRVYGVTAPIAQQYPLVATAAGELWRTAAGSWFEQRQTSLLGSEREAGLGGGVWMRVNGSSIERDVALNTPAGAATLDFDNSYDQRNITVTVGADLAAGGLGGANWAIGAMAGYARAELEFDQSANVDNLEGAHAGVYGSVTVGAFFLDASVNGAWLSLDSDTPALNLQPAGTMVGGGVSAVGAQAEAGWRLAAGPLAIVPLASLSYVTTTMDDLTVPAGDPIRFGARVDFDDVTSLRGGLGVRLSMDDVAPSFAPTRLSLTARAINETDGEVQASIVNVGPFDAPVSDTLDGTFSEIVGAVSINNASQTAAGYLNLGGVFGSDYQSVSLSAGFRYQW